MIKINEIVKINEFSKKLSFPIIIKKIAAFEFVSGKNCIKISNNEPRKVQFRNFGKLVPKKTLFAREGRIINDGNNAIFENRRRDNNM